MYKAFRSQTLPGVMPSADNLGTCHLSQGPAPKRLRSILSTCDPTGIPCRAIIQQSCDALDDSAAFDRGGQAPPRVITAAAPRDFKHEESLEAAPTCSTCSKCSFEDFNKSALSSEMQRSSQADFSEKLVIVMVGLPARGKSYITKKLCRYMNWLQRDTKIFNVGDRRRKFAGRPLVSAAADRCSDSVVAPPAILENIDHGASFFDPENSQASRIREQVAVETLGELLDFLLEKGGAVAIFDATNSTVERRSLIVNTVKKRAGSTLQVLFLESLCFDEVLLESNMRLKLSGPDYKDWDPLMALGDFKERIAMYKKRYVPLGEREESQGFSYCQMIDVGRKFIAHNIQGLLPTQVVGYLQHFNLAGRQVWITRHGESLDNVAGKIGGDAGLSAYGIKYAAALAKFIEHERNAWSQRQSYAHLGDCGDADQADSSLRGDTWGSAKKFHVWTSMMKRSVQTAQFFENSSYDIEHLRMLDELNAGMLEGLTEEEVKEFYFNEYEERRRDKLRYRNPGTRGEGYVDVTKRLQSVILEMERVTDHVLLIGGLAVARVLLAYCRGLCRYEIADLPVPLGTLYMLEPKPYGVDYKEFIYNPETEWFD